MHLPVGGRVELTTVSASDAATFGWTRPRREPADLLTGVRGRRVDDGVLRADAVVF